MATILPHTTRATGTVLTAAIYNADHQNHITNANALNSEVGTVTTDLNALEVSVAADILQMQTDLDDRLDNSVDMWSYTILVPANDTYIIQMKVPFGCTVVETTTKTGAGTATVTYKINTTALGGAAHSATTTENSIARSSANAIIDGDDFSATISAVSGCTKLSLSAKYTRTF